MQYFLLWIDVTLLEEWGGRGSWKKFPEHTFVTSGSCQVAHVCSTCTSGSTRYLEEVLRHVKHIYILFVHTHMHACDDIIISVEKN